MKSNLMKREIYTFDKKTKELISFENDWGKINDPLNLWDKVPEPGEGELICTYHFYNPAITWRNIVINTNNDNFQVGDFFEFEDHCIVLIVDDEDTVINTIYVYDTDSDDITMALYFDHNIDELCIIYRNKKDKSSYTESISFTKVAADELYHKISNYTTKSGEMNLLKYLQKQDTIDIPKDSIERMMLWHKDYYIITNTFENIDEDCIYVEKKYYERVKG